MPDIAVLLRFLSFAIGIACLGVLLLEARRYRIARAYLPFYLALSVLVIGGLFMAYVGANPQSTATNLAPAFDYLESFIGRYGLMLTMPLFVHRAYGVTDRRREAKIFAIVLAAFLVQHLTEFGPSDAWDKRGDVAEDLLFVGVFAYCAWFVVSNLKPEILNGKVKLALGLSLLVGVPGFAHDLFLEEFTGLNLYPLWYPAISVVATWLIVRRTKDSLQTELPASWNLSARETEVAQLVKQGLSNKEIAQRLGISPNTVKTHLRSIFEKSGATSRFELIASTNRNSTDQ